MAQAPPYGQQTTTIITTAPVLPATPVSMQCPQCQQHIVTEVAFVNGTLVILCVIVLLLFGCWLGCCLIPLCIDDLKDVEHRCPQCHAYIGTKKRL